MKKYFTTSLLLFTLCAQPLWAQGGKLVKTTEAAAARVQKTVMGASVRKAASAQTAGLTLRNAAWERKIRSAAVAAYDKAAAKEPRRALSRLTLRYHKELADAYALTDNYIAGFFQKRVEPTLSKPKWGNTDGQHFYRGMLITPEELADILQNGLSLSQTNWNTGAEKGRQILSFSTDLYEARSYIFQQGGVTKKGKLLGVVFETPRDLPATVLFKDPTLNATNTIYHCYTDVPAAKFTNVYLHGEYGLEALTDVLRRAAAGKLGSNAHWVSQFDPAPSNQGFFR